MAKAKRTIGGNAKLKSLKGTHFGTELMTPITIPWPPEGLLLMSPDDIERCKNLALDALRKAQFRKIDLLLEHMGIAKDERGMHWVDLAFHLACEVIPGLWIDERKRRPKEWSVERLLALWADVEVVRNAGLANSDLKACEYLATKKNYAIRWQTPKMSSKAQWTKSLQNKLAEAKGHPFIVSRYHLATGLKRENVITYIIEDFALHKLKIGNPK